MIDRRAARDYVAILDIGSNAVRLVIYDGFNRAPVRIHMERRICNLGGTLATTGNLNPEGVDKALNALRRFSGLIGAMRVRHVHAVATAALRDAADGPDFIARVQKEFGLTIRIIDGEAEAHLSAAGVMMNGLTVGPTDHTAPCLIGDYGGGSLELIALQNGVIAHKTSLPLGSHRLQAVKGLEARIKLIEAALDATPFLNDMKNVDFYALGGAWRSMAKAHMHMVQHPLYVLDHYTIEGDKARDFAALIARQSYASLEKTVGMSKKRLADMNVAALAMEILFARVMPARLIFSATGLREGLLYEQLKPAVREQDALMASCRKIAAKISRFDDMYNFNVLCRWMLPLFADQDAHFQRLVQASCYLSDLSWFEHEDYQAGHAFERVLVLPLYGADHPARVFLALSQYVRYRGYLRRGIRHDENDVTISARRVLPPIDIDVAVIVGLAQRIGYLLTGGALTLLNDTKLELGPDTLTLTLEGHARQLDADIINDALCDLAEEVGRKARVVII